MTVGDHPSSRPPSLSRQVEKNPLPKGERKSFHRRWRKRGSFAYLIWMSLFLGGNVKKILFFSLSLSSEVQCDHPESTKDGFIEVSNFKGSYVYGSRATYHCNPGFILWGNATRMCNAGGSWTGHTPQCQPIACGDPITFPHASVALLNGSTVWRAVAQYACIHGYKELAAAGETGAGHEAPDKKGEWVNAIIAPPASAKTLSDRSN